MMQYDIDGAYLCKNNRYTEANYVSSVTAMLEDDVRKDNIENDFGTRCKVLENAKEKRYEQTNLMLMKWEEEKNNELKRLKNILAIEENRMNSIMMLISYEKIKKFKEVYIQDCKKLLDLQKEQLNIIQMKAKIDNWKSLESIKEKKKCFLDVVPSPRIAFQIENAKKRRKKIVLN